ncbi:MAG: hypothetical protein HY717_24040 [Planctomycetes bacterium]|nr:hypothetical protein [Planctomycetota bacterium]
MGNLDGNIIRLAGLLLLLGFPVRAEGKPPPQDSPPAPEKKELPPLQPPGAPYRTPLSGAGFKTTVFGREIEVPPRDRRSVSAWDLGLTAAAPGLKESEALPFGSLFLWRHPDDRLLFRAVIVGFYDEIFFAKSAPSTGPFEGVLTLENFTIPSANAEYIDGRRLDEEELYWGRVRPGIGFGYRKQMWPGEQDNMLALTLTGEPSFSYFEKAHDTAGNYVEPQDTFEPRLHLQARWDAMLRNLLELPHLGVEAGGDYVYGFRVNWDDWGANRSEKAEDGRDYQSFTGYLLGAAAVPFLGSDRHRLIGSVHGSITKDGDRFSNPRIGGGPTGGGEEFGSTYRPVIPGAGIDEFFPSHYTVGVGEYRWEPIFFTYLSARASVAYLDRLRRQGGGVREKEGVLSSIGARITTGFLFHTRLQIDYNYNFGVIRQGEYGGHEMVAHFSGAF